MTALYLDTNIGCTDYVAGWTAADEGKKSFLQKVAEFLF